MNPPASKPVSTCVTQAAPPPLRFQLFKVKNARSIAELESKLGAESFAAVLKINRLDKRHIRIGDSLIVPDFQGSDQSGALASDLPSVVDLMSLAPFPVQLDAARHLPKLVLVSRRVQAFGAYESGRLVRWGPTSTGKKSTPTPAGLYHANWKAKKSRSSVNASWVLPWVFNLDNFAGVSFHQYELPGYPASHGCVRLLEEDAKWIYDWADQWTLSKADNSVLAYGTPVVIFGDYTYGARPGWTRLIDDPNAASVSLGETESALNKHMAIWQRSELKARARRELNARNEPPQQEVPRFETGAHQL